MPDLAATDLTLTVEQVAHPVQKKPPIVKIAFGNGALTYPSGGVPLPTTPSSWGLKRNLLGIVIIDQDDNTGIVWKYDYANKKLRGWRAPAQTHAHDLKIIGGQAATTDNELGYYATDILGKEAATNTTIAKADSATKGGVMSETLAAASLTEITGAVAAQTLYVEALGA